MSYIHFDKKHLVNLQYALKRELIRSNRAGGYASKTLPGCNTRKYHGLLVLPQPAIDDGNHVLLANLDETIIQHDAAFNLGIHKFPGGVYQPKGHKYLRDFFAEPIPTSIFRVGGVILKREIIFASNEDRLLVRYTLEEAHSPTTLRLTPFLAFRNVHTLTKANIKVDKKYTAIKHGVKMRMYSGYSYIHMQTSKQSEYTHVPDWYYNVEYQEEQERGYEYQEDLYVPGFFEFRIRKGESVVFSAGISQADPKSLKRKFTNEVKRRIPRDSYENSLINAAEQFIMKKGKRAEIMAGFPWFGRWGRDTFIALPGLTIATGELKLTRAVIQTMLGEMNGPFFPNLGKDEKVMYNSVDTPLWFFWTLQQLTAYDEFSDSLWKDYGRRMKKILTGYKEGVENRVRMLENGLLTQGQGGLALTWMDAEVHGKPVTTRKGLAVEINALWYNAIMFSLELAEKAGEKKFVKDWKPIADKIPRSFVSTFWDEDKKYLADYVDGSEKNWDVRPNMLFAVSLPYSPLDESKQMLVLETVKRELLTSKGLRTLSPKNDTYKGRYEGDQVTRDEAYHQGTVFPWLLGAYADATIKLYGEGGKHQIEALYKGLEEEMWHHGIGTISEVYDGDPPHQPGGAISQAWSVAETIRMGRLLGKI